MVIARLIKKKREKNQIDAINNGTYTKEMAERLLLVIKKGSHRDFTKGFFYKKNDENDEIYN